MATMRVVLVPRPGVRSMSEVLPPAAAIEGDEGVTSGRARLRVVSTTI